MPPVREDGPFLLYRRGTTTGESSGNISYNTGMKKIVFAIAVLAASAVSFAAEWQSRYIPRDELTEDGGYTTYKFITNDGAVSIHDSSEDRTLFVISRFTFDFEYDEYHSRPITTASVGIYNESRKLVQRGRAIVYKSIDYYSGWLEFKGGVSMLDVCSALCKDGYTVRIVIPTYGASPDFDVTLSAADCFKQLSWIPENIRRMQAEEQERAAKAEEARLAEEKRKEAEQRAREREYTASELKKLRKSYASATNSVAICEQKGYTYILPTKKREAADILAKIEEYEMKLAEP